MKTRSDFVTNSSSSSFVIVTTRENYLNVVEELHPAMQALAKKMFSSTTVFGKKCMEASTMDTNGCSWNEYLDLEYSGDYPDGQDADSFLWEAWDKLCSLIQEDEDSTFTHHQDM